MFKPNNLDHPHILSIIVDLMDLQIPWKGTHDLFGDAAMQMLICGIKEHGYGILIFPALKTVSKSANLIIFVAIDTVIEKWRKRHGNYPTYIYYQLSTFVLMFVDYYYYYVH